MKSSKEDLRKRGFVTHEDVLKLAQMTQERLFELVHSNNAVIRSAAACNLSAAMEPASHELLKQLSVENAYTQE